MIFYAFFLKVIFYFIRHLLKNCNGQNFYLQIIIFSKYTYIIYIYIYFKHLKEKIEISAKLMKIEITYTSATSQVKFKSFLQKSKIINLCFHDNFA